MQCSILYMLDCWAGPVVHLLLLKSYMLNTRRKLQVSLHDNSMHHLTHNDCPKTLVFILRFKFFKLENVINT